MHSALEPLQIHDEHTSSERIAIAIAAERALLRSMAARLTVPGYASPPRLVFALEVRQIPVLVGALRSINEVQSSLDAPRCFALARSLGTLWLAQDVTLDLIGLPLETAFSPTWSLVLPSAVLVVRLSDADNAEILRGHCEVADVELCDARSLVTPLDLGSPPHVAELLAGAIRAACRSL